MLGSGVPWKFRGNSNAHSEKLNRVDIYRPSYPSSLFTAFQFRSQVSEHRVQASPIHALQQELGTITAGTSLHRRPDWAEQSDIVYTGRPCQLVGQCQKRVCISALWRRCPNQGNF